MPGDIIRLGRRFCSGGCKAYKVWRLKSRSLTGESVPSEKDSQAAVEENAPLGDRLNMVYSGCTITYGSATAVVTATGMKTEMGRIAGLLDNEAESDTPLQKALGFG